MKVVYEKAITEKIATSLCEAEKEKLKIEYLILTKKEAIELYDALSPKLYPTFYSEFYRWKFCGEDKAKYIHDSSYLGVKLKVEGYK